MKIMYKCTLMCFVFLLALNFCEDNRPYNYTDIYKTFIYIYIYIYISIHNTGSMSVSAKKQLPRIKTCCYLLLLALYK